VNDNYYLDTLISAEAKNYERSLTVLGAAIELVDLIGETYATVVHEFTAQFQTFELNEQTTVVYVMFASVRYQLLAACASLLRGHIADSKMFLRKAIELTLFAVNTCERPKAAAAWLNIHVNEKKYLEEYKIFQIIKRVKARATEDSETKLLIRLVDNYESCSLEVHPTFIAVARSTDFDPESFTEQLGMGFSDPGKLFDSELIDTFLWTIQNVQHVLFVFCHLFHHLQPDFDLSLTGAALAAFNEKFNEHARSFGVAV
jgi:hypothetical protein